MRFCIRLTHKVFFAWVAEPFSNWGAQVQVKKTWKNFVV